MDRLERAVGGSGVADISIAGVPVGIVDLTLLLAVLITAAVYGDTASPGGLASFYLVS